MWASSFSSLKPALALPPYSATLNVCRRKEVWSVLRCNLLAAHKELFDFMKRPPSPNKCKWYLNKGKHCFGVHCHLFQPPTIYTATKVRRPSSTLPCSPPHLEEEPFAAEISQAQGSVWAGILLQGADAGPQSQSPATTGRCPWC